MNRLPTTAAGLFLVLVLTAATAGAETTTPFLLYSEAAGMPSTLFSPKPRFIVEVTAAEGFAAPPGVATLVQTEHYLLVEASADRLAQLQSHPEVKRLQPSFRLHLVLDQSRPAVNLGETWSGSDGGFSGYSGEGVVLGAVDTGIDPTHSDFRQADGSGTRIAYLNDYDTGRLWEASEISDGSCTSTDTHGHGTHIAGIMAGNGNAAAQRQYAGLAPTADLIVVKSSSLYSDAIIEGVDFIYAQAAQLQQPAVVNLSLESRLGPHDGTSPFERMLSELTGPGRLLAVAAGNGGELCIHDHQTVPGGGGAEIRFNTGGEYADYLLVDIWLDCGAAPDLTAITPEGQTIPVQVGGATSHDLGWLGVLQFSRTASPDPYNLKHNATLHLAESPDDLVWRVQLGNNDSTTLILDAWSYNASFIDNGCTTNGSVSSPATADSAIAVGATVSRISWPSLVGERQYADPPPLGTVAPFSNHGPGINGALIPTLAAPGMGIMASLSAAVNTAGNEDLIAPGGQYILMQGTSMAAPHVAGALGLALQKNPQLGCAEAVALLQTTAAPLVGQEGWDEAAGAGQLDVTALMAAVAASAPELVLAEGVMHLLLTWDTGQSLLPFEFQLQRRQLSTAAETLFVIDPVADQSLYSWLDATVAPGEVYEYFLTGRDEADEQIWRSNTVAGSATALTAPLTIARLYPNPSAGTMTVRIASRRSGAATLRVWDLLGRELERSTVNLTDGVSDFPLDLAPVAAGVYFVGVEQGGYQAAAKALLLRR